MKTKLIILVSLLLMTVSEAGISGGVDNAGGGDFLKALKYANLVEEGSPLAKGQPQVLNERYYRYALARAARTALRKLRLLVTSGYVFKDTSGQPVQFNEAEVKKYEQRLNDLEDSDISNFKLVSGLRDDGGTPLTAKNYPAEGRIEFNPERWEEIQGRFAGPLALSLQEAIAAHELLSLDLNEKSDYYPVVSPLLTESFPPETGRMCKPFIFSFSIALPEIAPVRNTITHRLGCMTNTESYWEVTFSKTYYPELRSKGPDMVSATFSTRIDQNPQIRNPAIEKAANCAVEYFFMPLESRTGEALQLPTRAEQKALYRDSKVFEYLRSAHLAQDPAEKARFQEQASYAFGEAFLFVDDLLKKKKWPAQLVESLSDGSQRFLMRCGYL